MASGSLALSPTFRYTAPVINTASHRQRCKADESAPIIRARKEEGDPSTVEVVGYKKGALVKGRELKDPDVKRILNEAFAEGALEWIDDTRFRLIGIDTIFELTYEGGGCVRLVPAYIVRN